MFIGNHCVKINEDTNIHLNGMQLVDMLLKKFLVAFTSSN